MIYAVQLEFINMYKMNSKVNVHKYFKCTRYYINVWFVSFLKWTLFLQLNTKTSWSAYKHT